MRSARFQPSMWRTWPGGHPLVWPSSRAELTLCWPWRATGASNAKEGKQSRNGLSSGRVFLAKVMLVPVTTGTKRAIRVDSGDSDSDSDSDSEQEHATDAVRGAQHDHATSREGDQHSGTSGNGDAKDGESPSTPRRQPRQPPPQQQPDLHFVPVKQLNLFLHDHVYRTKSEFGLQHAAVCHATLGMRKFNGDRLHAGTFSVLHSTWRCTRAGDTAAKAATVPVVRGQVTRGSDVVEVSHDLLAPPRQAQACNCGATIDVFMPLGVCSLQGTAVVVLRTKHNGHDPDTPLDPAAAVGIPQSLDLAFFALPAAVEALAVALLVRGARVGEVVTVVNDMLAQIHSLARVYGSAARVPAALQLSIAARSAFPIALPDVARGTDKVGSAIGGGALPLRRRGAPFHNTPLGRAALRLDAAAAPGVAAGGQDADSASGGSGADETQSEDENDDPEAGHVQQMLHAVLEGDLSDNVEEVRRASARDAEQAQARDNAATDSDDEEEAANTHTFMCVDGCTACAGSKGKHNVRISMRTTSSVPFCEVLRFADAVISHGTEDFTHEQCRRLMDAVNRGGTGRGIAAAKQFKAERKAWVAAGWMKTSTYVSPHKCVMASWFLRRSPFPQLIYKLKSAHPVNAGIRRKRICAAGSSSTTAACRQTRRPWKRFMMPRPPATANRTRRSRLGATARMHASLPQSWLKGSEKARHPHKHQAPV